MFEQLEDGDFDHMYSSRKSWGGYEVIDLAHLPVTVDSLERRTPLIFSRVQTVNTERVQQVVIGFDGRESFLLTRLSHLPQATGVLLQCSSTIALREQQSILQYVLNVLNLGLKDCLWFSKTLFINAQ